MSLKDQLASILDVFSRRPSRRYDYPPATISETLRNRVLLLFRDIVSGRWKVSPWSPTEDRTHEFWEQMHNALQHLYGRAKLSSVSVRTPAEDVIEFLARCRAEEFFDFIELSFKLDVSWRVMSEENDVVDAVNDLFRIENAPFQLTSIVKVREQATSTGPRGFPRVGTTIRTVAYPKVVGVDDQVMHTEAVAPALSVLSALVIPGPAPPRTPPGQIVCALS